MEVQVHPEVLARLRLSVEDVGTQAQASDEPRRGIKRSTSINSLSSLNSVDSDNKTRLQRRGSVTASLQKLSFDGGLKTGWLDEMIRREQHVQVRAGFVLLCQDFLLRNLADSMSAKPRTR